MQSKIYWGLEGQELAAADILVAKLPAAKRMLVAGYWPNLNVKFRCFMSGYV